MAELSAKDLILLCPTALPCWWVWSHGGAQDQNLQSLQEPRGSSTLLRYYCSAPESRAEQCVCLCVKGWNWKLLPFCPSQFVPSRAGKYFAEYAAREWGQWGISSLLFRLTCSPSLQQWLTKFLSCRLESSSGVTPRPRGKAGVKSILSASQCQNRGFGQQVTDGHQNHCNSLWANHPTSSSPREEKGNISTASTALLFLPCPSLTLCKLEHALSKIGDEPEPSASIDHPELPRVFHIQTLGKVWAYPKLTCACCHEGRGASAIQKCASQKFFPGTISWKHWLCKCLTCDATVGHFNAQRTARLPSMLPLSLI